MLELINLTTYPEQNVKLHMMVKNITQVLYELVLLAD